MTGLTLVRRERLDTRLAVTIVQFAALSDEEIAWYVASGEPFDKAGAYAVQGLASRFVTRIEGSYSNVVGLPVALLYEMLREVPPDFLT
jgi:septum formation protein